MRAGILSILAIFVWVMATSFRGSPKMVKTFISSGNDLASIQLTLYDNHKYIMDIRPLGEGEILKYKGRWKIEGEKYRLRFKKKHDLKTIFDRKIPGCTKAEIVKNKIFFPVKANDICIWGIACVEKMP